MRRDVFQAIADPTRRQIIELLAGRERNLNSIAGEFAISRPAISKHIRILEECGLIRIQDIGRERFCRANLAKLKQVAEWTRQYEIFWNQKMDALGRHLSKRKKK
jgi:DNA-binding transcriptional ArsR family regulator